MDENDIKAAVLTRIRREARGRPLPVVTSEFSLNGTRIRADLAVLDACFYGVEIKSASDTLKRLPSQMEGYARYFDRTMLVVAPKHVRGLRDVDLHGAEVWRQEVLTDWQLHKSGETRRISGQWLQHLLTANEERRAARLVSELLVVTPAIDVDVVRRSQFEIAFQKRYSGTSRAFWEAVRGRKIAAADLKLLSRFHANRQSQRNIERQQSERWAGWMSAIDSFAPLP